ncbi:hypothetical protein GOBAR_DD12962 [Gossypium barbadense]|nr:hypothetical protein GOBAR_DD12962 [Gossypium barbadense]
MSDTKETTGTNDTSFTIYSPSSKHNASSKPPKTSPSPPQEEKHSPPPPLGEKLSPPPPPEITNSPPKQSPKSSPSPSPPSSSGSPPTPPKQESPPSTTPQSPPQPPPTQKPPPSHTPPTQQLPPSPNPPKQKSPPSPSSRTHEPSQSSPKNSPPESQPTESSSDNKPSLAPPSPETSQSPPSTNSTSTSVNGSEESMPGFSPKMAVVPPSPSSPISPSNSVGGSSNNNSESSNNRQRTIDLRHPSYGIVIGVAIASLVVIAFIAFSFIRDRRKKKQKSHSTNFVAPPANISVTLDVTKGHPTQNDYAFSNSQHSWDSRKGQNHNSPDSGGFGCVYKGQLPGGKIVAVKQLKIGSGQGEREFRAEVEIISRVHHRHLVSLVGYCIANDHRLLIYEFVSNSNLERHLHDTGLSVLEWAKRVKIAIGAAKGLAYLHEDYFGLARLINTSQTHVSTRVMGTFGYLAPEYASSGKLTDRSDVYSFGVVLLELITGRKPVDPTRPLGDESLVEWARPLLIQALEAGNFGELIDPRLEKRYVEIELFRMIEAAAACVRHSAAKRPRMALVIFSISTNFSSSTVVFGGKSIGFRGRSRSLCGIKFGQSTAYDSSQYSEEITKFRRMEFGSDNSSDYDMYGDDHISGESSGAQPSSWKSWYSSGESQAQASKPSSSGSYSDGSRNYGSGRFR